MAAVRGYSSEVRLLLRRAKWLEVAKGMLQWERQRDPRMCGMKPTAAGGSRCDSPPHGFNVIDMNLSRITHNPAVMGGKPCIRGLRITVSTIVGLLASGETRERILQAYPLLESADIDQALAYAAWRLTATDEILIAS